MQTEAKHLITDHLPLWTATRGPKGKHYGIKKLRELILELAVRGLLVPQNPDDEPAAVLLERIAKEKARLVKEKKIKKQQVLPAVGEDEKPFVLPEGWEWTNLRSICLINPRNNAPDDTQASFVPMPLISTLHTGEHGQESRKWGDIKKGYTHFQNGDVAVAKITPCFENSKGAVFDGLVNGIGAGTTELHIARPVGELLNPRFVLTYLKAPMFLLVGETRMTGTAGQKRLPKEFFAGSPFPLPPLAEQHRIVAKVDELMALCSQLEQQQSDSHSAHQTLVDTLLSALTREADQRGFSAAWQRIAEHFDTLFTTEQSIDALKQTILQLAVMGKLVPQNPDDEPAAVLLERIAEEKARLVKEGKIKKQKALPEIGEDEKLFPLPSGWSWCQAAGTSRPESIITYGVLKPVWVGKGIPTVRIKDMVGGRVTLDNIAHCSIERAEKFSKTTLKESDLLIAKDGATLGKTAFVPKALEGGNITQHILRLSISPLLNRLYVRLVVDCPYGQDWMSGKTKGVALPGVNVSDFRRIPFPIPPSNEQHRIVTKVDELMALCDNLKARLQAAQTTQQHLADAIAGQALA